MSLDARDVRILRSIAENDSTSPERIQEETNIPKSTVHYRIKNMKDRGVIKNDLFEIDFEKAGLGLTVISEVLAEFGEGYQEEVGKALAEIEGVNEVYFMMGILISLLFHGFRLVIWLKRLLRSLRLLTTESNGRVRSL